jgi:hypothetical protein
MACPFPPGNGFAFSRNPGGLRLRRRKNAPNPSLTAPGNYAVSFEQSERSGRELGD